MSEQYNLYMRSEMGTLYDVGVNMQLFSDMYIYACGEFYDDMRLIEEFAETKDTLSYDAKKQPYYDIASENLKQFNRFTTQYLGKSIYQLDAEALAIKSSNVVGHGLYTNTSSAVQTNMVYEYPSGAVMLGLFDPASKYTGEHYLEAAQKVKNITGDSASLSEIAWRIRYKDFCAYINAHPPDQRLGAILKNENQIRVYADSGFSVYSDLGISLKTNNNRESFSSDTQDQLNGVIDDIEIIEARMEFNTGKVEYYGDVKNFYRNYPGHVEFDTINGIDVAYGDEGVERIERERFTNLTNAQVALNQDKIKFNELISNSAGAFIKNSIIVSGDKMFQSWFQPHVGVNSYSLGSYAHPYSTMYGRIDTTPTNVKLGKFGLKVGVLTIATEVIDIYNNYNKAKGFNTEFFINTGVDITGAGVVTAGTIILASSGVGIVPAIFIGTAWGFVMDGAVEDIKSSISTRFGTNNTN